MAGVQICKSHASLSVCCGGGVSADERDGDGVEGERQEDRSGQQLSFQGGASMNVFPHFLLFCSSKFSFMSLFYHGKKAQFTKIL